MSAPDSASRVAEVRRKAGPMYFSALGNSKKYAMSFGTFMNLIFRWVDAYIFLFGNSRRNGQKYNWVGGDCCAFQLLR